MLYHQRERERRPSRGRPLIAVSVLPVDDQEGGEQGCDDGRGGATSARRLTAGQDTMRRRAADLGGQLHVENGSGGTHVHLDARVELSPPA